MSAGIVTTRPMRVGSLFSGYGGLDLAVSEVFGGETVWFCEIEDAPSAILAHHWPDIPNLGDITGVDWSTVTPIDVLVGGFPCQDVSPAGRRAGLKPGTRSGLWSYFAYAISKLRPQLVVIENVRGLLSAEAHSDMEPCPWCVGDRQNEHLLRALGAVLGDLADLGYDARWCGLQAADVGAPHGRYRIFVVAHPADIRHQWSGPAWDRRPGSADGGRSAADATERSGFRGFAQPTERDIPCGDGQGAREDRATANAEDDGRAGHSHIGAGGAVVPLQTDVDGCVATHTERCRCNGRPSDALGGPLERTAAPWRSTIDWGVYEPAVRRWQHILGRPAPSPTEPGRSGQRLSPRFVEWMMGLPAGWVTDVPGIARNAQLKALGNGVVPQQAAAALRAMTSDRRVAG